MPIRLLLVVFSACPLAAVPAAKLDAGIDPDATARYPVFVRMDAQLFRKAGDYEAFCQGHARDKRSSLRKSTIDTLRKNADASWKAVEPALKPLAADGSVRSVQRYWIVNGFACLATGVACRKLAESAAVAFVYRQTAPVPQHAVARRKLPAATVERFRSVYKRVLAAWKDDSDEAFSTKGLEIPWNVKRVGADAAWTKEQAYGKGVVVALMDSGLMVTPSLTAALWRNQKETLNGKDDDGNGYVDDLFGYDFGADSFYALGDGTRLTHGSMCGGIIAGRPLNSKKLATGVAPRAKLMVLRGMGYLKSYEYALSNGADVVSMSFMFIGSPLGNYRGVYRLAHEHLSAAGVVAVGGAGNFNNPRFPKGKQIAVPKDIPCVICAAGVLENGRAAAFSSRGPVTWNGVKFYDDYPADAPLRKPDVTGCIGGYPVWGRPGVRRWKTYSAEGGSFALVIGPQGNSFSGPHAAGVAALMLSVNPELNPWEVKELMEKTCRDLGEKGRDDTYGAGLLQAAEAVRAARGVKK